MKFWAWNPPTRGLCACRSNGECGFFYISECAGVRVLVHKWGRQLSGPSIWYAVGPTEDDPHFKIIGPFLVKGGGPLANENALRWQDVMNKKIRVPSATDQHFGHYW